ncbi:MAG TPA: FAD-dependent oxidoreductase [Spirochaetota bacterium]|nr:FAD-dependent oxidoreductase [Spirochaetota bacterium]HPQ49460.1 FAD-dependent oxidoreductase [Spirochaetota bacterium]
MHSIDQIISYSYIPITENKVGTWRFSEPFFDEKTSPCSFHCPINQEISHIMILLENKKYKEAFLNMFEKNPLLYTTGSVCPAFCKQNCNRKEIDSSIDINNIESYLGKMFIDYDISETLSNEKRDDRICIIGFGPAGISLSYQLAKKGFIVDVFEKMEKGGGMPIYGIPDIRLDKKIAEKEIKRIEAIKKINVYYSTEIKKDDIEKLKKEYKRVIVATGLQDPVKIEGLEDVYYGIDVLIKYHTKKFSFPSNGHYLVLGGGNTAMDVALYLLNNSNKVDIIARRDVLRAFEKEVEEVKKLGANIIFKAELKEWDKKRGGALININGKEDKIKADGIFICFGQKDKNFTDLKNIEKIGDIGGFEANLSTAIASGLKKAYEIIGIEKENKNIKIATIEMINKDIIEKKDKTEIINNETLIEEASRCIKCGICTECKVCETFCPDLAIDVNKRPEFDYDYCKGCGICYMECPRGVISLREVNR